MKLVLLALATLLAGAFAVEGLTRTVVEAGDGKNIPTPGAYVSVHYTGKLLDGTKFDSSRDRDEPFEFTLGQGEVIPCWDEGVAMMSKGEKAVLECQPDMAYGSE